VKTVNQIVTLVVLLLLLVLLPIIATVPDAVLNGVQSVTFSIEPWAMTTVGRVVIGVVSALLWLVVIWLLWREIRGGGDKSIQVQEVGEGRARVAEASVARLLEKRVASVPDVKSVTAKTRRSAKEGVIAELTITTNGGVRVPDVSRMSIEAAREALEAEIGAKVERVDVRVKEVGATAMAPLAAAAVSEPLTQPDWSAPEAQAPAHAEPEPESAEPVVAPQEVEPPAWTAPEPQPEPEVLAEAEPPSWLSESLQDTEESVASIEEEVETAAAEVGWPPVYTPEGDAEETVAEADEDDLLAALDSEAEEEAAAEEPWRPYGADEPASHPPEPGDESAVDEWGAEADDEDRPDVEPA